MQKLPDQITDKLKPAIYVDFDGTLATYEGWGRKLGKPIPAMVRRVKAWKKRGLVVKIFTARITTLTGMHDYAQELLIHSWIAEHGLGKYIDRVTNIKGPDAQEFWDDRAVRVELNTGRRIK